MCGLHAFEKAIDPKKLRVERWNHILSYDLHLSTELCMKKQ
jgi:hypothetical protein